MADITTTASCRFMVRTFNLVSRILVGHILSIIILVINKKKIAGTQQSCLKALTAHVS